MEANEVSKYHQSGSSLLYKGPGDGHEGGMRSTLRQIYAAGGERGPLSYDGFYRGLNATILRDVFFARK